MHKCPDRLNSTFLFFRLAGNSMLNLAQLTEIRGVFLLEPFCVSETLGGAYLLYSVL